MNFMTSNWSGQSQSGPTLNIQLLPVFLQICSIIINVLIEQTGKSFILRVGSLWLWPLQLYKDYIWRLLIRLKIQKLFSLFSQNDIYPDLSPKRESYHSRGWWVEQPRLSWPTSSVRLVSRIPVLQSLPWPCLVWWTSVVLLASLYLCQRVERTGN